MQVNKRIETFFTALVIILSILLLATAFNLTDKFRLLVVNSGSMEPELRVGSLIFVLKRAEYNKGDIVTYTNKGRFITHRIVATQDKGARQTYATKGDQNELPDQELVPGENIVGKVAFHLPWIGRVSYFSKTLTGAYFSDEATSGQNSITAGTWAAGTGNLQITKYFCPSGTAIGSEQQPDASGNATIPAACSLGGSGFKFGYTTQTGGGDGSPPSDGQFSIFANTTDGSGVLLVSGFATGTYGIAEFSIINQRVGDSLVLGFLCSGNGGGFENNYEIISVAGGATTYCNVFNLQFGGPPGG